jgi:hypothetical protein
MYLKICVVEVIVPKLHSRRDWRGKRCCGWPNHAMMTCATGYIAPHILDVGSRLKWVVLFKSWPLYPKEKNPQYLLDRRLRRPQANLNAEIKISASAIVSNQTPVLRLSRPRNILTHVRQIGEQITSRSNSKNSCYRLVYYYCFPFIYPNPRHSNMQDYNFTSCLACVWSFTCVNEKKNFAINYSRIIIP